MQAIRGLAKIGGFPSDQELEELIGDPESVKAIKKDQFVGMMKKRVAKFASEGGQEDFFFYSLFSLLLAPLRIGRKLFS